VPGSGNILVIRGGAIGDFILTLPVLAALRAQFPQSRLEVLGYSHIAALALAGGLADAVQSIETRALAGFFALQGNLSGNLTDYFSEFDLIISYLYDPDEIFQRNVQRCSKAQFLCGPHRPDETLRLHAAQCFLKPLERLAVFDADPVPRLSVPDLPAPSNRLAIHPGSGSERKNWPEEKWRQLLERLATDTDFAFLLIGGEAEGDRLDRLGPALPPARLEIARNLPLPALARTLSGCRMFLGHDSGIAHLAGAVGRPGIILWGESREETWRPLGGQIQILRHPAGLAAIPVDVVLENLRLLVSVAGKVLN
jgi:ADP-heptose:LPS heptosyltransferase